MPIDAERIRSDVAVAMRDVVVARTPFDYSNYHEDIVPSAEWPDGFGANEAWWHGTLVRVDETLANRNPFYRVLSIIPRDAQDTVGIRLAETNNMLTDRIVKAAAKVGVA